MDIDIDDARRIAHVLADCGLAPLHAGEAATVILQTIHDYVPERDQFPDTLGGVDVLGEWSEVDGAHAMDDALVMLAGAIMNIEDALVATVDTDPADRNFGY